VNELLIGAFGAILALGVIDGVMYALISLFERGEKHRLLRNIQAAGTDQEAVEVIADDLDYILEPITEENVRQKLYFSILDQLRGSQPRRIGFTRDDLTGALGHVIVAVIAVLPSLAPLVLLRQDTALAIRVSNLVSFIVLFIVGYRWGQYSGANLWKTGLLLTTVAVAMVLIAILLGG
jgi:VIT1/CCC1 family predicted Fe2+/Mn2+ transporter